MSPARDQQLGLQDLPSFLCCCVQAGIIEAATAERIEAFRRESGVGMARALAEYEAPRSVSPKGSQPPPLPYQPLLLHTPPSPQLTFESLVPFRSNELPIVVARAIAEGEDASLYTPFYVYGDFGFGKTHTLSAIANDRGRGALLVNAEDLDAEILRAYRHAAQVELRSYLYEAELLLIDDIQFCDGRPQLQHEIIAILSHMMQRTKPVVLASDVPPTRLANVDERLIARLGGGVIVGLGRPSKAERAVVVAQMAGREISEVVVDYLASRITDNVRRLRGAVKQLLSLRQLMGCDITLNLARSVVPLPEDLEHRPPPGEPADKAKVAQAPWSRPEQLKQMLASAETEEEQSLALQIAIDAQLRELRDSQGRGSEIQRLGSALALLRDGRLGEALQIVE